MKTSIVFIVGLCLVIGAFAGGMTNSGGNLKGYKPPAKPKITPPKGECLSSFCQTIQKNFTLTAAGKVTLNFEVNIAEKSTAKTPVAYVKWNGVVVYTIYACDTTKSVSIQVDGKVGCNTLVFCSVGGAPVCTICFTNICVSLSICNPGTSGNLVKNGNFTDVTCNDPLYCQFDVNNIGNKVPWWIPDDKVVVANASLLNTQAFNSSNKWAASLIAYPKLPTGIAQIVTMTPGVTATLEFTYAPVITGTGAAACIVGNPECYNF